MRLVDGDLLLQKICKSINGKDYISKVLSATKDELQTAMINIPIIINSAQTIQEFHPVKYGKWENTNTPNHLRCSNCDIIHFIAQYPEGQIYYCPNCGAKMKGDAV